MCMYIDAKCEWAGESDAGIRRMYGKTNSFTWSLIIEVASMHLFSFSYVADRPLYATDNLVFFLAASFSMTIYLHLAKNIYLK